MAAGGDYGVQSGSGNVMLGANTGAWLYNWVKQHLPRVCDSQAVFYRPWEKGFHPFNENKPQQIHGVSQCFHAPLKPKANNVNVNDFIELRWE